MQQACICCSTSWSHILLAGCWSHLSGWNNERISAWFWCNQIIFIFRRTFYHSLVFVILWLPLRYNSWLEAWGRWVPYILIRYCLTRWLNWCWQLLRLLFLNNCRFWHVFLLIVSLHFIKNVRESRRLIFIDFYYTLRLVHHLFEQSFETSGYCIERLLSLGNVGNFRCSSWENSRCRILQRLASLIVRVSLFNSVATTKLLL